MNDFKDLYKKIFGKNNLSKYITDEYAEKFYILTEEMLRVNKFINLTSINDAGDIISKHYADSLLIAEYLPDDIKLIDVGTGAGFPALPLAVIRESVFITALDSTLKKLTYISDTARLLNLKNIETLNMRAEIAGKDKAHRERYDVSCARAVAPLNILCEYCLPLVKPGGKFIAMKSAGIQAEINSSAQIIEKLGGKFSESIEYELQTETETIKRAAIIIKKIIPTPVIYPRGNAQITKRPL